jgi:hypothetical protein
MATEIISDNEKIKMNGSTGIIERVGQK